MKPTVLPSQYHSLVREAEDCVTFLEMNSAILPDELVARLQNLSDSELPSAFSIDEVSKQFELVQHMRKQLLDPNNNIMEKASVRELAALVASISALIRLFLSNEKKLNSLQEISHTKQAVLAAISSLPSEEQAKFFEVLDARSL